MREMNWDIRVPALTQLNIGSWLMELYPPFLAYVASQHMPYVGKLQHVELLRQASRGPA